MDRALSSDRRDYSSGRGGGGGGGDNYYGGGGGGGYHHRNDNYHRRGGRGRGRGGRGGPRFQWRGGGGPYDRRGGPRRHSGNRFQAEQQSHDPKQAAVRQLLTLLTHVGALKPAAAAGASKEQEESSEQQQKQRAIVAAQAKNIQALTGVLCGSKADIFLQYESNGNLSADKLAGPLASGLVHCMQVWPLQTPCYAALTLAVHEHAAGINQPSLAPSSAGGVGQRCLEYTLQLLARDLDGLLLEQQQQQQPSMSIIPDDDRHRAVVRVRMTLRYLALLAQAGMVQGTDASSAGDLDQAAVLAATNSRPVSVAGLLNALVQAAVIAASERHNGNKAAACLLAAVVWSTIPYIRSMVSADWILDHLILPLEESMVMEGYQSQFAPGIGSMSILLKAERHEQDVGEGMDDEEEEDEDDDDEEEASNQVCDSFQDLLRTVKYSLKDKDDNAGAKAVPSRFALFTDAPWKELHAPKTEQQANAAADQAMGDDDDDDQEDKPAAPPAPPLVYTSGEPMALPIFPLCKSLTLLLGGDVPPQTQLARNSHQQYLNGLVFGRLPFFGPPPDAAAGGDEDDEEEEDMQDDDAPVNERLQAYKTQFGMVDRFFLGEAVRDCLMSHEGRVTDAGVQNGGPKDVAEQIWSLGLLLLGDDDEKANVGIEYCILEVILSLICQCERGSPLRCMYLSRVLLELTRLQPAIVSPAIALGVWTLFQDYMPALVPMAGYNLSRWFAFHLTNTDYQWPGAYWKHWEPYVAFGWSNSRGAFCKGALSIMMENLSNPELLVKECLPKESAIVEQLLPPDNFSEMPTLSSLEDEVQRRIWEGAEDSVSLLAHLASDEMGETIAGALVEAKPELFGRTCILVRSLLQPLVHTFRDMEQTISKVHGASADDANAMADDGGGGDGPDPLSLLLEKIEQYQETLRGVMSKDASILGGGDGTGEADENSLGLVELFVLEQFASASLFSRGILEACMHALLRHKIVQVSNLLKWSLGETADDSTGTTALRWWEIVSMAINVGVANEMSSDGPSDMAVDGQEDEAAPSKQEKLLNYLDPLLSYMIQRVSFLLTETTSDKPNKLTAEQVDLVEGFKYVALDCQNLFVSLMQTRGGADSSPLTATAIHEALSESAIAGPKLASLMDAGSSVGADVLRLSLERL